MLRFFKKLTRVVDLTDYSDFIKSLEPHEGKCWDNKSDEMKQLKSFIRTKLEGFQSNRCAYCGLEYKNVAYTNIEHIGSKDKHPQFMFHPFNLVGACPRCNGFEKKGTVNTITTLNKDYAKCKFTIVHPYFHEPSDHFRFVNGDEGLVIQILSTEAEESVRIFKLNDVYMIQERAKQFLNMHTTDLTRKRQIEEILNTKCG